MTRALAWLLAGLLAGVLATHVWEHRRSASDIAALTARQADQLREAQTKLDELRRQLHAEHEQREALERLLAELRRRAS
jgi:Skp family chaperone for outer membrane proteins